MARVLPESRLHARRRKRRIILSGIAVVLCYGLVGGLVWLSWRPALRIQTVRVEGAQTVASTTLERFVRQRLLGAYLGIIPRDNIFVYPKSRIEGDVRAAYPVFATAAVRADNFSSLSLAISERQPKETWCGASPDAPQPCLFLDESGAAYGAAPAFSGSPYVRYYGPLPGEALPKQFLSPGTAQALFALIDAIGVKAGEVESVSINTDNDVQTNFVSGFVLKFSLDDDSAKIFQRFALALGSTPFTAHPLSAFLYLDLRFGDKLYYKLR